MTLWFGDSSSSRSGRKWSKAEERQITKFVTLEFLPQPCACVNLERTVSKRDKGYLEQPRETMEWERCSPEVKQGQSKRVTAIEAVITSISFVGSPRGSKGGCDFETSDQTIGKG